MEINAYIFVRHLHQLNIFLLQKVDFRKIPQDDVESKLANLGLTETFTQFFRRQSSLSQARNSTLEAYFAHQIHSVSQPLVKPKIAFLLNQTHLVSRA